MRFQQIGKPDSDFAENIVKSQLTQAGIENLPAEMPPCVLYRWTMLPSGQIFAELCENHPYLGTCKDIRTGTITYIDRTLGIATSKRTSYILKEEKPL